MNTTPSSAPFDTGLIGLWFGNNYGAIMTTYALYRLLQKMGKKPLLLDQSPFTGVAAFCKAGNMSRRFMQRHDISVSEPLHTDEQLAALNEQTETFIIGSDQVWRWQYSKREGSFYFLDFARWDKRKVAVAASFGVEREERPAPLQRKAKYYLRRFDAVSVREKSGLELLRRHYETEGEWVLDPVFLHGTALFKELSESCEVPSEPYLLSYVLEPDAAIRSHIEQLAAERGFKVINMVDGLADFETMKKRFGTDNIVQGVTPEQWVAYIRHCAFFVTDSFHGVCFAHLFNRDFLCVAPPMRGLTRFESLLGLTGLQNRLLPPQATKEAFQAATTPIDWERVNSLLESERARTLSWLEHALTAPRTALCETMGRMTDELLYAGKGQADRDWLTEAQVQQLMMRYRTRTLPLVLGLKRAVLRLLCYCPLPSLRAHFRNRLQAQRVLAQHLRQRPY